MTEQAPKRWERTATERLRVLWIIARAMGGRLTIGRSFQEMYPGDDEAVVLTHTDPTTGDLIVMARSHGELASPTTKENDNG